MSLVLPDRVWSGFRKSFTKSQKVFTSLRKSEIFPYLGLSAAVCKHAGPTYFTTFQIFLDPPPSLCCAVLCYGAKIFVVFRFRMSYSSHLKNISATTLRDRRWRTKSLLSPCQATHCHKKRRGARGVPLEDSLSKRDKSKRFSTICLCSFNHCRFDIDVVSISNVLILL